jgi:peroxiredoxin
VLSGLITIALVPVEESRAAKFNRVLDIGDRSPQWKELPGTDGKQHGLDEFKATEVVVVVFFCNHCPVAKAYEERLLKLARHYRNEKKSVDFVAISVSRFSADRLDEMKRRASEKKYPFPYLSDASQELGRKYGAYVTPQVFVLNRERRIAYMGAVDDSMDPDDVTERFLQDAVDAVLTETEPEVQETKPVGCHIAYE